MASDYIKRNGHKVVGRECLADGCTRTPTFGVWCDQCRPYERLPRDTKKGTGRG